MVADFTHATFAGLEGQTYHLCPETASALGLVLIEALLLPSRQGQSGRQPFSLMFRGPRQPWLPQGTYPIRHQELGTFDLFVVPLGPDEHGMRYQAIFS